MPFPRDPNRRSREMMGTKERVAAPLPRGLSLEDLVSKGEL
jgi:hypothetical protein